MCADTGEAEGLNTQSAFFFSFFFFLVCVLFMHRCVVHNAQYIFTYARLVFVRSVIHIGARILLFIGIRTLVDPHVDVTDCFMHSPHIKQK